MHNNLLTEHLLLKIIELPERKYLYKAKMQGSLFLRSSHRGVMKYKQGIENGAMQKKKIYRQYTLELAEILLKHLLVGN